MGGFTIWQGLGILVGAIAGFYTGGAGWAMAGSIIMGASIGYGIGSLIDPNMPDIPQAGEPAVGSLDMPTVEEGLLIPDFLGTERMAGNIIWYDGARSKAVKEKVKSGGKGGGSSKKKKVVVGYNYYLSWAIALAWGPVDELLAVWRNDELVWSGNLVDTGVGAQTITLDGMGSCTFHFGNTSQIRSTKMTEYLGVDNPAYRGLCYAVLNDCFIGSYNRAPTLIFVMRKTPAFDWSPLYNRVGLYDYNPIHSCYYVLRTLAGLPAEWFDETAIASAASEAASINEGHGLSILFSSQRSAQQYLETILSHVSGIMRYTNESKFTFELMRATTAATSLLEIVDDDFVEEPIIMRKTWVDIASEIKIQHHVRYDEGEAEGLPDIYSFSFCDESLEYLGNGRPYVLSDGSPGTDWLPDYNAAIVSPKPGQVGDMRWFGFMGHVAAISGYGAIIPTGYSKSSVKSAVAMQDFFNVPYSPTGQEGVNILSAAIALNGWRPGSWFVFSRDITGSNTAPMLANGAAQIANIKAWLVTNYPQHYVYSHDEELLNERWLDWLIQNVTGN